MHRLLTAVLVTLALLAPAALGSDAAASTATHTRAVLIATQVRAVSPLDAAGHLRATYDVRATGRGYCWTTSFVNGRLYRCFRGHVIHDPCWKESGRRSVVCPDVPSSRSVLRIRLTRRLPATDASGPRLWGLRRLDGVGGSCLASTGAGGWIGHRHISFYCHHGWVLVGGVDREHPTWSIATARRVADHYELRGRKPLGTAWRPVR